MPGACRQEPPKGHEGPTQATPSAGDSKPTASGEGAERSPRREFAGSLAPAPTPHLAKGWDQAGEEGRLYLNETWKPSHYSGWGIFIPKKCDSLLTPAKDQKSGALCPRAPAVRTGPDRKSKGTPVLILLKPSY